VYPAIAVLQAIQNAETASEISLEDLLWVGGQGGMEKELVERAGVSYVEIPAAGVHGVGLRALPRNVVKLLKGVFMARSVLRDFRPDVMLFTGGFVAGPVALAGLLIPSVLYVPDIEPGLALKALARFANEIAVTTEDSRAYFSPRKRVTVTGYPTRSELTKWTSAEALQAFDLRDDLPVLMVFGGSKGARSINQSLLAVLPQLLNETQIIHVSGRLDWPEVEAAQEALAPAHKRRYRAFPYLHAKMGAAFRAADLVLSRAGASVLGEFPLFGLPAILVPYPYAWRYQKVNAQYLAQKGAAIVIRDEDLPERILPLVHNLMSDTASREKMQKAMLSLSSPHAASEIVRVLAKYEKKQPGE